MPGEPLEARLYAERCDKEADASLRSHQGAPRRARAAEGQGHTMFSRCCASMRRGQNPLSPACTAQAEHPAGT